MIFEKTSIRSVANSYHVSNPPKMLATKDKIEPLGSQKVRPKNKQLRVTRLMYFVVPYGMGKC
jgi:hypothetical protein